MTLFLIAAVIMVATALAFILQPLLRKVSTGKAPTQRAALNLEVLRDQLRELDVDRRSGVIDEIGYGSARRELERRVAADVCVTTQSTVKSRKSNLELMVGPIFVALAATLYLLKGTPAGIEQSKTETNNLEQFANSQQVENMVRKLANHLKARPGDVDGWAMLARSYDTMGNFKDAANAYAHLMALMPQDADVLVDYAASLASARNKNLQGEPESRLRQALELDPNNIKALVLLGSAAYERHDYQGAMVHWKKAHALIPQESGLAHSVASSIEDARELANASDQSTQNNHHQASARESIDK
jgi:cytochrome c-type biogenesis protein CcmH